MDFTHLRTKTHYSLQEGLMEIDDLVAKAKENGHTSLALTEFQSLKSILSFISACKKEGIKPIVGADLRIETDLTDPDSKEETTLLILAENEAGYKKIMELITRANVENREKLKGGWEFKVKQSWLEEMGADGLFALTGNPEFGEIPRACMAEDPKEASDKVKKALSVYRRIFGDRLFLEVQRNAHEKEDLWVDRMVKLSAATSIPLVATNDVMFGNREDFYPHEVRVSVTSKIPVTDPQHKAYSTREQYYTSTEEMLELFSDIPQAVENAGKLAKKCNTEVVTGVNHLPNFPIPDGESLEGYFKKTCMDGLEKRLEKNFSDKKERDLKRKEYIDRLETEIDIINNMEFPGYFLVVSDFIRWTKSQGIPVGPGRGSGAGSLVAYSLDITDIDPIEHNLLFERFLNPERVSMPDIDIDFCRDRREETLQYIFETYGEQSVAQISTLNTLTAKAVIRHVGKSMNLPLMYINEIANSIPKTPGIKLDEALEQSSRFKNLYDGDGKVRKLVDMSKKIEGRALTNGLHAGGIVISPTKISDYSPMVMSEKDVMVVQFDKDDIEKAGLIKFDLLGLKTLTLVDQTIKLINSSGVVDKPLKEEDISIKDEKAMDLLREGDTYGVFQLESQGMVELVKNLQPDSFEDVVACLALYRPGPLNSGMVDSFVARKHGREEISYYHPKLEKILKPTYGIIVYQEQVMQIAQEIAGYTLGGADLLRRAMGKKKPEEMAKERVKFETGAKKNGVDGKLATELFDVMEKFAEYGFNRSHSAAYAKLSMQTAYLKAHHPEFFFAAYMNVEKDKTDVLDMAKYDMQKNNLHLLAPDINTSNMDFEVVGDRTVSYGISALKGVQNMMLEDIIRVRDESGEFKSLPDFLVRLNDYFRTQGRNAPLKATTQTLIHAGAFDRINPNRDELKAALEPWLKYIGTSNRRHAAASSADGEILLPDLWKHVGIEPVGAPKVTRRKQKPLEEPDWPESGSYEKWDELEKLKFEKAAIGYYFTGHPYDTYCDMLEGLPNAVELNKIPEYSGPPTVIAGLLSRYKEHVIAKNGNRMAFLQITDGNVEQDVTLFSDAYDEAKNKLKVGAFLAIDANIKPSTRKGKEGTNDVIGNQVWGFGEFKSLLVDKVNIVIDKSEMDKLQSIHETHKGNEMGVCIYLPDGEDRYFKSDLKIKLSKSQECVEALERSFSGRVKFDLNHNLKLYSPDFSKKNNKYAKSNKQQGSFRPK